MEEKRRRYSRRSGGAGWLFWQSFASDELSALLPFQGGLQYDSINQLTQVVTGQYSNHHPIYHTLWLTLGAKLAEILGGDLTLGGILLYRHASSCFFLYGVLSFKDLAADRDRAKISGDYSGLFPRFPYHLFFAAYVNKDTLFTCCGVILLCHFIVCPVRILQDRKRADVCHMLIGGLGVSLLRSNGLIAIGILFFIFCWGTKGWREHPAGGHGMCGGNLCGLSGWTRTIPGDKAGL